MDSVSGVWDELGFKRTNIEDVKGYTNARVDGSNFDPQIMKDISCDLKISYTDSYFRWAKLFNVQNSQNVFSGDTLKSDSEMVFMLRSHKSMIESVDFVSSLMPNDGYSIKRSFRNYKITNSRLTVEGETLILTDDFNKVYVEISKFLEKMISANNGSLTYNIECRVKNKHDANDEIIARSLT